MLASQGPGIITLRRLPTGDCDGSDDCDGSVSVSVSAAAACGSFQCDDDDGHRRPYLLQKMR